MMATAALMHDPRTLTIPSAISDELDRQARAGAIRIDVDAMAVAIDSAIDQPEMTGRQQMRAAKRPEQLNATNDA